MSKGTLSKHRGLRIVRVVLAMAGALAASLFGVSVAGANGVMPTFTFTNSAGTAVPSSSLLGNQTYTVTVTVPASSTPGEVCMFRSGQFQYTDTDGNVITQPSQNWAAPGVATVSYSLYTGTVAGPVTVQMNNVSEWCSLNGSTPTLASQWFVPKVNATALSWEGLPLVDPLVAGVLASAGLGIAGFVVKRRRSSGTTIASANAGL